MHAFKDPRLLKLTCRISFLCISLFSFYTLRAQAPATLVLQMDKPGAAVSPKLYGLMTEEINYSYDGGLYGELIRNRIFKNDPTKPESWSVIENGGAKANIKLIGAIPD